MKSKKIVLFIIIILITGCSKKLNVNDNINFPKQDKYEEIITSPELTEFDKEAMNKGREWVKKKVKENKLIKLYQTTDNINIYSSLSSISYKEKGETFDLKESLETNKININDFIKKLEYYNATNDGGSVFYKASGNLTDTIFYVAKCNSLPGNGGIKDIFIDTDKEEILDYCVYN